MRLVFAILRLVLTLAAWGAIGHVSSAAAATCTSLATGNWNNPATWSCAAIPGIGDDVVIANLTHTVTVTVGATSNSLVFTGGIRAATLAINGGVTLNVATTATINAPTAGVTKRIDVRANGRLGVGSNLTLIGGGGGGQNAELRIGNNAGSSVAVRGNLNVNNARARVIFSGAGTLSIGGNFANGGTFTRGTGTVVYNGAGAQNVGAYNYQNLTINKGGGSTAAITGVTIVSGNLLVTAGALNVTGFNFTVTGTTGISGTLTHTAAAGTKIYTGIITINAAGTWLNPSNSGISIRGGIAKAGTFTSGTGLYNFDGGNPTLASTSNITFAGNVQITGNRFVANNTLVNITGNLIGTAANSRWRQGAGSTLNMTGVLLATGTLEAQANNNTVNYTAPGVQAVKSATYHHLTISSGGPATPGGNITVRGNLSDNGQLRVALPCAAGTFRTVTFGGIVPQNLIGAAASTTFCRLTLNNTAPPAVTPFVNRTLTLAHPITLNNQLNLNSGRIIAGANLVTIAAGATVNNATGAPQNRFVAGQLQKNIPAGLNRTTDFEVGSATPAVAYAPIRVFLPTVTVTGNMQGSTTAGDHPQIGSSGLDASRSANRYWTLANLGVTFPAAATTSTRFTFVAADLDGGANPLLFDVGRYNAPTWTVTLPPTPTRTATTTTIAGVTITPATIAGEYAVAEKTPVSPTPGGFNAYETSTPPGQITGVLKTKVAGAAFGFDVIALDATRTAILTTFFGDVTVELLDASDNTGVLDPITGCRPSWTMIAGASQVLTFTLADSGRKTISFTQNNAWQDVRVRMTYTGGSTVIGCSGDNFAIRPASLTVALSDNDWQTAGTGRVLDNILASGGVAHKAGQPFTITVTPNPNTVTMYAGSPAVAALACTLPAGCVNGTLDPGTFAGNGARVSNNATYTEVGTFNLTLEDQTFANVDAGDSTPAERYIPQAGGALAVGRFVPDHFDLTVNNPPGAPTFRTFNTTDATCSAGAPPRRSFTYIGQQFGYVLGQEPQALVTARNSLGNATLNYSDNLWKITAASVSQIYANTPVMALTPTLAIVTVTPVNGTGTGTVTANTADRVAFDRSSTTPQAQFNADLALTMSATDASEAGAGQGSITTTTPAVFASIAFDSGNQFRYGRLRLQNANGSQLIALPVPMQTQYWTGSGFATNTADNCTTLPNAAANVALGNPQPLGFTVGAPTVGGAFNAGIGTLRLPPSGAGTRGSVDVSVNLTAVAAGASCTAGMPASTGANLAYLQGAWCGATYDRDPTARATFGVYKNANEFIYQRENF